MWSDNETDRDFLNFSGIADTVAEIIVQAKGRPLSLGLSGEWGSGKSSMIRLVRKSLSGRAQTQAADFVFVEFNAWLYQGYDDARAALLEVIAHTLEEEAKKRRSGIDRAQDLLRRVNWLRAAKLTAGSALALALGLPPIGLVGDIYQAGRAAGSEKRTDDDLVNLESAAMRGFESLGGLLKVKPEMSPPREIHALRQNFEETLSEIGVTLVVLIDDLDRCLPSTTISTLEAIRLFLFLKNTAFVIAADTAMIRHAVRKHFDGVTDELVTNYFDKLIQIPIRVPPLGTQEVRAYMALLFIEQSEIAQEAKDSIREKVCQQLSLSWQNKRVDRTFVESIQSDLPPELLARLDTADRLAPLMASASSIAGNPRLVKRFLNALSIRASVANAIGVGIDESVLSKMLLFERCGDAEAYKVLTRSVNEDVEGKPRFLEPWERATAQGESLVLEPPWQSSFVREWLAMPPQISSLDLRGLLYVSRDHAPFILPEDRLSSTASELLKALLESPDMADRVKDRLKVITSPELKLIMDRLLDRARREQEWGTPPILNACLVLSSIDQVQGRRLAEFLRERPPIQITPAIVPKIASEAWAPEILRGWRTAATSSVIKKAITTQLKDGDIVIK